MSRLHFGVMAGGGLFLLQCLWFRRFSVDDAYIAYRHARHWAEGFGPVMNAGERVEGVSNLPWTALLALGSRSGLEPHLLGPVLGVVCGLATVLVTARAAARAGTAGTAATAALLLAACAPLAIWSVSGMETAAYIGLVAAFLLLVVESGRGQEQDAVRLEAGGILSRRRAVGVGLVLGLLACLRPEGILVGAAWLLAQVGKGRGRRRIAVVVLAFTAVALPFLLARLLYYGDWLPNPVRAKGSLHAAALLPGLVYLGKAMLVWLPLAGLVVLGVRRLAAKPRAFVLGWLFLQALFMVLVGGERFPGHRFLVPALPVLAVVAALATGAATSQVPPTVPGQRGAPRRPGGLLWLPAVAGMGVLVFPELLLVPFGELVKGLRLQQDIGVHQARLLDEARFLGLTLVACSAVEVVRRWRAAAAALVGVSWLLGAALADPAQRACRRPGAAAWHGRIVGTWLRQAAPAGVVVATNAAGALPYFSRLPVIDMLGLTDAHIARSRSDRRAWIGHERGDGDYVLERHPDIIILGGPEGSETPWGFPGDRQIAASPDFARHYERQQVSLGTFTFTYHRARNGRMPPLPLATDDTRSSLSSGWRHAGNAVSSSPNNPE